MVVSKPAWDATASVPVCSSRKQPVPYVFLASIGRQRCPSIAACWSPRQPARSEPRSGNGRALHACLQRCCEAAACSISCAICTAIVARALCQPSTCSTGGESAYGKV